MGEQRGYQNGTFDDGAKVRGSLIAIHGNGGGGYRFHRVEPYIPRDLQFFAVTLPGFGFSAKDPGIQSLQGFAEWLRQNVVSGAPRPCYLLGHGIGGSIACEYLQHFSDSVDGVILHAPVGAHLEQRWFPRLMRLPGMRPLAQHLLSAPLLTPLWQRLLFRKPVPRDVLRRFFAEYRACKVFGELFNWIDASWFRTLRPMPTPAVILWGEKERVLRSGQAASFEALFPAHHRILVSDWDHFPMLETPSHYAQVLLDCIAQLEIMQTTQHAVERAELVIDGVHPVAERAKPA